MNLLHLKYVETSRLKDIIDSMYRQGGRQVEDSDIFLAYVEELMIRYEPQR